MGSSALVSSATEFPDLAEVLLLYDTLYVENDLEGNTWDLLGHLGQTALKSLLSDGSLKIVQAPTHGICKLHQYKDRGFVLELIRHDHSYDPEFNIWKLEKGEIRLKPALKKLILQNVITPNDKTDNILNEAFTHDIARHPIIDKVIGCVAGPYLERLEPSLHLELDERICYTFAYGRVGEVAYYVDGGFTKYRNPFLLRESSRSFEDFYYSLLADVVWAVDATNVHLYLSSFLECSGIYASPVDLLQFKMKSLSRKRGIREASFHKLLRVEAIPDIRQLVISGEITPLEIFKLRSHMQRLREWLTEICWNCKSVKEAEQKVITEYARALIEESWLKRMPGATLRFLIVGLLSTIASSFVPGLGLLPSALDRFLMERFLVGWTPHLSLRFLKAKSRNFGLTESKPARKAVDTRQNVRDFTYDDFLRVDYENIECSFCGASVPSAELNENDIGNKFCPVCGVDLAEALEENKARQQMETYSGMSLPPQEGIMLVKAKQTRKKVEMLIQKLNQ